MSEEKDRKKSYPLKWMINVVICILSVVAVVSLFCTPIIKVDIGKLLGSEELMKMAEDMMDDAIGDSAQSSGQDINFVPVVSTIVKQVFSGIEGSVEITGVGAGKVLSAPDNQKTQVLMNELMFGDNGLVSTLIESVVDAVGNLFTTDEGKAIVEEAVVSVLVDVFSSEIEGLDLTKEDINELKEILQSIDEVENNDVSGLTNEFIGKYEQITGTTIEQEDKDNITSIMQGIYDDAVENLPEGESVTMEVLISVAVSSAVDLSEFNIAELLQEALGSFGGGSNDNNENQSGYYASASDDNNEASSGGNGGEGSANQIVTSYDGLLTAMGFGEADREALKADMRAALENGFDGIMSDFGELDQISGYYGYLLIVLFVFASPWIIQFIFAFIHIFTRKKHFSMWYTKLLGWLPAIIWLALKLAPLALNLVSSNFGFDLGEYSGLIDVALGAIQSYTFIVGLCYIFMWVTSISNFIARKVYASKGMLKSTSKYGDDNDDNDDDYGMPDFNNYPPLDNGYAPMGNGYPQNGGYDQNGYAQMNNYAPGGNNYAPMDNGAPVDNGYNSNGSVEPQDAPKQPKPKKK